jgi:nitrite reductase (NO-forming)
MKKIFVPCTLLILFACGGNSAETNPADEKYADGKKVYDQQCAVCHQTDGKGIQGTYPPLAASDYMLENRNRAIDQAANGSTGLMTVNGIEYDGVMPPQNLTNKQVVDVLNYIFNSWGNKAEEFTAEEVAAILGQ